MLESIGLFSGGKDSYTACKVANVKEVTYCNTGVGLNFDYVLKICKREDWKLNVVYPKDGQTYEDFVKKYGFPHYGVHSYVMHYLKQNPLRQWLKKQKREIMFVSGRRKKESKRRMRMKSNKEYYKEGKMFFYCPIINWTTKEVYDYIKDNKLELSPIYETMHMSGDCFCGAFAQKGESQLLYTFHKDLALKIQELESKYGGHWGNGTSITGSSKQQKLTELICMDCIPHYNGKG